MVAKLGRPGDGLDVEGRSLTALRDRGGAPTPEVLIDDDDLLVMRFIPNDRHRSSAEAHAGAVIAALHNASAPHFGFDEDVRVGPLPQPNPPADLWVPFFIEHRLAYMADIALRRGSLAAEDRLLLDRFMARLERLLPEPDRPSLLHGDLWSGNVLFKGDQLVGLIDPAVCYGAPEIDLAMTTLFGPFGEDFFESYCDHRQFDYAGFLESRRDIYSLWPLLTHAALFGGGYGQAAMRIVRRFL